MKTIITAVAIVLAIVAGSAQATSPMEKLEACRELSTTEERTACYVEVGKVKERADAAQEKSARAKWAARPAGVHIGMTQEQTLATQWGKPSSVNRTTTAHGVHEQWVYSIGNYLYFDNGILTAIQN